MENTNLSERETEIIKLVGQGKSNKDIAQDLFISVNTVKVHLANIFRKIEVTSRTEATLYAIEHGLVDSPRTTPGDVEILVTPSGEMSEPEPTAWQRLIKKYWWGLVIVIVALLAGLSTLLAKSPLFSGVTPTPNALVDSLSQERWTKAANLPQPGAGMAVTTTQNSIFLIGGMGTEGASDLTLRFDKTSSSWVSLAAKPTAVSEVRAAVVGGKIYVVGGMLADGSLTDILEVYSPETDTWETRAPTPMPLSNYGMTAFEGQIYIFGGWDGSTEMDTVFKYDPSVDEWEEAANLPTARADPAVVTMGDRIYVIGGAAGGVQVKVDEVYMPNRDAPGGKPWSAQIDLPGDFELLGAQSVMDTLFIFGRGADGGYTLRNFTPQNNVWNEYAENPPLEVSVGPRTAVLGGEVYFIGGYDEAGGLTDSMVRYQAVYTIVLPRISN